MDKKNEKKVKTLTGVESTGTLRHLPGTNGVAGVCFNRGGGARGGVLRTGRTTLWLF